MKRSCLFVFSVLLVAACKPATREFQLHGQVIQSDPAGKMIVVRHGDIPGFMPGMIMPYKVKQSSDASGLRPGDVIDAKVSVLRDGSDYWLSGVRITQRGGANSAPPVVHMLKPGEHVPNLELIDQDGKPFHLADFKGKAVLMTFIYTRCPLPEFCPRLTSQFARIQDDLAKTPEDYARTHLVTVSFDSEYDTPPIMRKYGLAYLRDDASGFSHWDFASAKPDKLREVANAFGLVYIEEDNQISHTMNIVLIGPDGTVSKYWSADWTAPELEDALRQAAHSSSAHGD
ncbi:MAG TPA: SCO family protein [Terriglobia bacterium]|jgi:protein SCO1/2